MYHYYHHPQSNQYVTDVQPQASQLWAIIGPEPYRIIIRDDLEPLQGYRWLTDKEWNEIESELISLTLDQAASVGRYS